MAAENDDFWSEVIGEIKQGNVEEHPDDFAWTDMTFTKEATVLDMVLQGDTTLQGRELGGRHFNSMQSLTDKGRSAAALDLPQEAGTRVRFVANLGSVLSYDDIPDPKIGGTIVTVKTANGPRTDWEGRVFVSWDDGKFRPILAEHLRLAGPSRKHANTVRMVVANLGDISGLFVTASRGDELIHRATKDLWSFKRKGDNYVIERLFDDTGKPLKV